MAGAHKRNFEFGHQNRDIESMEFNSNFSSEDFEDDISIITVTEPFDFSDPHVQPIDMFKTNILYMIIACVSGCVIAMSCFSLTLFSCCRRICFLHVFRNHGFEKQHV